MPPVPAVTPPAPPVPHSSRGPGHRPLKAEIIGSNPICGTNSLGRPHCGWRRVRRTAQGRRRAGEPGGSECPPSLDFRGLGVGGRRRSTSHVKSSPRLTRKPPGLLAILSAIVWAAAAGPDRRRARESDGRPVRDPGHPRRGAGLPGQPRRLRVLGPADGVADPGLERTVSAVATGHGETARPHDPAGRCLRLLRRRSDRRMARVRSQRRRGLDARPQRNDRRHAGRRDVPRDVSELSEGRHRRQAATANAATAPSAPPAASAPTWLIAIAGVGPCWRRGRCAFVGRRRRAARPARAGRPV